MTSNLGLALSEDKAFLILVENDGYTVEEYPCTEFGVKNFEGCFSFTLENQLYFGVQKTLYQFLKDQRKWEVLAYPMKVVRHGTACVSLKHGTIIAGGSESDGVMTPKLKDSCVLIRSVNNNLITTPVGKLPTKVKHHSLAKLSDNSFIMTGGIDVNGHETRGVYLGTLKCFRGETEDGTNEPSRDNFCVIWTKLPSMREYRSSHFSMFVNNRLHVFGGGLKRAEDHHVLEVNAMQCGLEIGAFAGMIIEILPFKFKEKDQFLVGERWERRYMKYDISFASIVLSPDKKYGVIAGGEIYGYGARKYDNFHLTMNTRTLFLRSLQENDKSMHTNNVLKMILSCSCLTPMYDDIETEL